MVPCSPVLLGDQWPFVLGPVWSCRSSLLGRLGRVILVGPRPRGCVITSTGCGVMRPVFPGTPGTVAPGFRRPDRPWSAYRNSCSTSPAGRRPRRCGAGSTSSTPWPWTWTPPGFHHSVSTDFRDRPGENDRADRLLSLALDRIRDAGVIEERGRQRTDSTRVLAAARELTRLEPVLGAVHAALEEASRNTPDVLDDPVDADRATRYGRPVRLPSHPVTRLEQAGADAHQLLRGLPSHRRGPRAEALRQIMVQNFLVDACGVLRPRTEPDTAMSNRRVRR